MQNPQEQAHDAQVTMRAKEYVDQLLELHVKMHELDAAQLELQASEYERRLTDLNHAHTRAQEDKETYVNKDVYNATQAELRQLITDLQQKMNAVTNVAASSQQGLAKLESTLAWLSKLVIGSVITALIAIVFQILNGRAGALGVGI